MKIEIKYQGSILNLPASVTEHLKDAGERELKVILGILGYIGSLSAFERCIPLMADNLELSIEDIKSALAFWHKAGVIHVEGLDGDMAKAIEIESAEKNSVPTYTGKQIEAFVRENKDIGTLFKSCQGVLGKEFNTHDYNAVLFLKSYYKFSDEYILLLLAHCVECEKPTWAYIRKTARTLYDEGIDTYERLEEHFAARKNKRSLEYKLRKLFGIGERELSQKEKQYFEKIDSLKVKLDIIKRAYEVSVDNTGAPSLAYTVKVVDNWLASGVRSLEDAERLLESRKNSKLQMSSFDTNDFFESAVKRSAEKIHKK
ncbi:MAG: DnaD domain protein [Clostridia bacterium]|nr:DnaD domain protein [Clostridia bacterium]